MKKIFFVAITGLFCFFTSCDSKVETPLETKDTPEQKNLAAFETISKAFDSGDVGGIDSTVADDYLDHTERGDVKGKDSLKAMIVMMKKNLKDGKSEIVNSATSGDYVYGRMRYTGTSDGSMGMPKGPYDMTSIELGKFRDGKLVEHWAFMQIADMMKMMAPQPPMGKMDNNKVKK